MFRALGIIMIIWYLSSLFTSSFSALDKTLTASLGALEAASVASQKEFIK